MTTFPVFILWAVAGHLANGGAFIIDKMLLGKSFSRPATYAGIVGLLGTFGIFLIPFAGIVPTLATWGWIILSGATFVIALLSFFAALASGEASRVVPVVGSLIPILTLAGTAWLLGERLGATQATGFLLLIIATILLSGGASKSKLTRRTILLALCAATFFAISFISGKISYTDAGFLTAFAYSRIFGAITAICILLIDRTALLEVKKAFFPGAATTPKKKRREAKHAAVLVLVGQGLGACGFVLVQFATSLGSAAIVNALQAVQYAFLVLVAFILSKRASTILNEDLTTQTIIRKSIALVFVAAGLWLVV